MVLTGLFGSNGVNLKAQLSIREKFWLVENVPLVQPNTRAEVPKASFRLETDPIVERQALAVEPSLVAAV